MAAGFLLQPDCSCGCGTKNAPCDDCAALPCPCPCVPGGYAVITFYNVTFCDCINNIGYWRDVGTGCEKFAPTSCWYLAGQGDLCGDGGQIYSNGDLGGGGGGRLFQAFSCDGTPGTVYNLIQIEVEHANDGTWWVLVYLAASNQDVFFMGHGSDPTHIPMVGNCVPPTVYNGNPLINCFLTTNFNVIWTSGSWASITVCPP